MTIAFAEENPFFKPFDRPYGTAPFNDIKMEHFEPAFEKGMEEHKVEIDKIASNSDAPTFENTIAAMEYSGKTLNRVSSVFFNLLSAESNDEMMEISQRLSPKLSAHSNYINLNEDLFKRVKSIYDERNSICRRRNSNPSTISSSLFKPILLIPIISTTSSALKPSNSP